MLARFNLPRTAAVVSGAMATLMIAAPAAARQEGPVVIYAPPENARTERVPYHDLALAERGGERTLVRRVAGAVKRVCLFEHSHPGLQDRGYYRCADDAWDGARPQIAQAVQRAREIAMTGRSSVAATAITISVPAQQN